MLSSASRCPAQHPNGESEEAEEGEREAVCWTFSDCPCSQAIPPGSLLVLLNHWNSTGSPQPLTVGLLMGGPQTPKCMPNACPCLCNAVSCFSFLFTLGQSPQHLWRYAPLPVSLSSVTPPCLSVCLPLSSSLWTHMASLSLYVRRLLLCRSAELAYLGTGLNSGC